MTKLTIQNMTIKFDAVVAVDDFNLEVEDGEFVGLLGPSGCGKTTTLRAIAGFLKPDAGRIRFDGETVNDIPPQRRYTAMVFQSYALFPHMTVSDNIRFGLRMQKIARAKQDRRIGEVIEMLGLAGMEARKPSQLSGGQQQRVALARAVVTRPRILLFDEPLSNLDAKLRERVRVEIRTLQRHLGITSIFVTHDQAEALNISDRIVVMNEGRVEQVGDPFSIYRYPANSFVADFIGLANIVEGRVVAAENGRLTLDTTFGRLHFAAEGPDQDDRVLFSWRPEDMVPYREGMANRLSGTISHAIFMGNFTDLLVDVGGTAIRVQMGNDHRFLDGEAIELSVPETKFHILR
jgi:iron(III) transport system ATP-binding protein